jgi:hypothetical protein
LLDAVMFEFTECLGQQMDDAALKFLSQYDSTAVEDNIAAFESEFLDGLSKVDPPLYKATLLPPKQDVQAWVEMARKFFLLYFEYEDQFPQQLGSLDYFVYVVGFCAISSPKQQHYTFSLVS